MAVLINDQERAGLDILTHGDLHVDEETRAMPMPAIEHIVVLMLENRSFDHMVGFMQSAT